MVIGVFSILLAVLSALPSFVPGAMSIFGILLSLVALILSCFSTTEGKLKYLISVLIIVTFNIFIVSEFSVALSKSVYSHGEPALGKIIHAITYNEETRIREKKKRQEFEAYIGHKIEVDYKEKEKGYWQFVRTVILIIFLPYLILIYCLYNTWQQKNT